MEGSYRRRVGLLLGLGCALGGTALAQPKVERVTTIDGRVLVGPTESIPRGLKVRTALADVYLTASAVAERTAAPPAEALPVYAIPRPELKAPKKGKIGAVLEGLSWSGLTAEGKTRASFRDQKHGQLTVTFVVSRVGPVTTRLECVEYEKSLDWPTANMLSLARTLVGRRIDATRVAGLEKAARFWRMAGQLDEAAAWLRRLEATAGDDDERVLAERLAQERARLALALREVDRLARSGRLAAAAARVAPLRATFVLRAEAPALAAELAAWQTSLPARRAVVARAEAWLRGKGAGAGTPTEAQARRVVRVLGAAGSAQEAAVGRLEGRSLRLLLEPWAAALDPEAVAGTRGTPSGSALLRGASALADAVAEWTATPDPRAYLELAPTRPDGQATDRMLDALASRLKDSPLPRALKLALLHTRRYKAPRERGWRKVTFVDPGDPRAKRRYHYYVRIPSTYRPDTPAPAMLSLHGRTSTAEIRDRFWGRFAERWGVVLIAPEYVYGRKYGYLTSIGEHRAVIGAWRHAALTLNLDPDRVFLEGASQGGFASWDIGGARAGELAGVIPSIGSPPAAEGTLVGLANTRVYSFGGSQDGDNPTRMRRTVQALAKRRARARYVEYRGRGHEAFVEEYDHVCRWMSSIVRPAAPERVSYVGYRSLDRRCRWVAVEASLPGRMLLGRHVEVVGAFDRGKNLATLQTRRARTVTILVDPKLVDLDRPLLVKVNGKLVYNGLVPVNWRFALSSSKARRDGSEVFVNALTFPAR